MASANIAFDRSVILASADPALRQRLRDSLSDLRWNVREARGGAEAIAQLENRPTEALLLDHWLPDLEVMELAEQIGGLYPGMEMLRIDGDPIAGGTKSPRRHELLHALREALGSSRRETFGADVAMSTRGDFVSATQPVRASRDLSTTKVEGLVSTRTATSMVRTSQASAVIEELVGSSPTMLELAHAIRLVAPRSTTVLIEGETGTGK